MPRKYTDPAVARYANSKHTALEAGTELLSFQDEGAVGALTSQSLTVERALHTEEAWRASTAACEQSKRKPDFCVKLTDYAPIVGGPCNRSHLVHTPKLKS